MDPNFQQLYGSLQQAGSKAKQMGGRAARWFSGLPNYGKLAAVAVPITIASYCFSGDDFEDRIDSPKSYVLTLNKDNTSLLNRLGWKENNRGERFEVVSSESDLEEAEKEMAAYSPSILVLTGHHNTYSGSLYGDDYRTWDVDELPASRSVEAVIFSACETLGDNPHLVENLYEPLMKLYPNLKLIAGYEGLAPDDDGIVAGGMYKTDELKNGLEQYVDSLIQLNPRIGAVRKNKDGDWLYHTASGIRDANF